MNEEPGLDELAPWLAIAVTVMGGLLRVLLLDAKGLWLDETFSVWLANHRVAEMLQWIVRIDPHPPLYYFLLHHWIALNRDTPYFVRLLSVLFGTGAIPIIYLSGKRISGAVMGLAAAVILALSPFHIAFAQETRMYTLLTFNAAVAIYALVRLLTDPHAARPIGSQLRDYVHGWRTAEATAPDARSDFRYKPAPPRTGWRAWVYRHRWASIQTIETDLAWITFIVFSAATMLTHNAAIFFPLAANTFVFGLLFFSRINTSGSQPAFRAPPLKNWAKAQLGILLLWSPWAWFFIRQSRTVYQRFWIPEPTWETVIQTLKSFLNASAPMPTRHATVIWAVYGLVLCLGLVHFRRKMSPFWFLAILFAVPFLGELLVSIRRPIFYDRTLIWITIPLFLLLAAGVAQLRFRFLVIAMLGILGTINLFSASDYFRFYQKEDWATAAGYVANFAEKDDLILFNSNFVVIPFDYYFEPYADLYSIQVQKQGLPLDLFEDGILEPPMTERDVDGLIALLREHDRVWLVYSHNGYTDPGGLIPQTLAAQMQLTRQRDFRGGQVQLYENP